MSWALIAGGSKGIGLGIAEALAKRKYDLLLIARDQDELVKTKRRLENRFPVQVEFLSWDLSLPESPNIIFNYCTIKNLEIKVLCNAAGLGGSKDFPELPLNDLRFMIRLNIESAVALSLVFLPLLKKTAPSYILNVGSMAGFAPIPIKTVYASTKTALLSYSYSLRYLLKGDKICVSCVCPGPVFTKSSVEEETIKQLGWVGKEMAVKPEIVGEYAVEGMLKGKMLIVPGKLAGMLSFLLRILPDRFIASVYYQFRIKNKTQ